jgi:hypothetical protein
MGGESSFEDGTTTRLFYSAASIHRQRGGGHLSARQLKYAMWTPLNHGASTWNATAKVLTSSIEMALHQLLRHPKSHQASPVISCYAVLLYVFTINVYLVSRAEQD